MRDVDTLIFPRWLIPVEPASRVLEDHAVAIANGRIVAVCPRGEAERAFRARETWLRPDHVALPGLVNAHTHAAMSLLRGLADDLPLSTWLNEHIWPAEGRLVSREFVADGTRLALAEMLRGGVTCFADMYFFPDTVGEIAAAAGVRAVVGMIVLEFPTPWAANANEYIERGLELHDRLRDQPLVTTAFAPHAPYTVTDGTLRRIRRLADELDVPVHMHVHESASEIDESLGAHGKRPLARLAALGLLNPALMAVHMTQLEDSEIEAVAAAGASVVHCPRSNLKLATGLCPVARLAGAGVNLALGTDGAASNNRLDVLGELQTAALLAKGVSGDPAALDAAAALEAATLGGARALGLAEQIGSLVPGKQADLICLDLSAPGTQPVLNPLSQVVYAADRSQVSDVWVGGRMLIRDGEPAAGIRASLTPARTDWAKDRTHEAAP